MEIEEAIKTYNELYDNENVKKYNETLHIILKETNKKPEREYYKSSNTHDFYIELPYKRLALTSEGAKYEEHGYNAIFTPRKDRILPDKTKYGGNFCLSLCKYSREKIQEFIEDHIREDNKED